MATSRAARATVRYPNEVTIPVGEAGQTKPGVILCHQTRTISLDRASLGVQIHYLMDPLIRSQVCAALARHLGLDIPPDLDGALAVS